MTTNTTGSDAPITNAPALEHDAMMAERFGYKVGPNGRLERFIVWNLCRHMQARGWNVHSVNDGEEVTKVPDAKAAMELIFNLDESRLQFRTLQGHRHDVFLVMGNGQDIISDYGFSDGDGDGFNAAMNAFDPEQVAEALGTAQG